MQTDNYWTGLADVISDELPENVKGAIYRVLTFAESYEVFAWKVTEILENSGDKVIFIEEAESLTEFLKHSWLIEDHEIYDYMQFSFDKNLNKIAAKVEANERLTFDEGVELYKTGDLNALGRLTDFVQ